MLSTKNARIVLACGWLVTTMLAGGCQPDSVSDDSEECTDPVLVGALELGRTTAEGEFIALGDGHGIAVWPMQALYGLSTSLRAKELDPELPTPSIEVYSKGVLIGANRAGETSDMIADGDGYVLENVFVLFQVDPCCFNCLETTVKATLVDKNCHKCEGRVELVLQPSATCPPENFCSCDESQCPAPLEPQICGE